ncbi:MAG TPA: hypothetical protein VFV38_06230 [Ktedonobacteraceae bacterium]|nr:hypothetical protein [Ktedonobacteraceae bacterium]
MCCARLAARWQPAGRLLLLARQHASTPALLASIDNQGESVCWFSLVSSSGEAAPEVALGAIVVAARKQGGLTDGLSGLFRWLAGLSGAVDGIWWMLSLVGTTSIHNSWLCIVERLKVVDKRPTRLNETYKSQTKTAALHESWQDETHTSQAPALGCCSSPRRRAGSGTSNTLPAKYIMVFWLVPEVRLSRLQDGVSAQQGMRGAEMKQITHTPDELPYHLVNFGVDTLVLNVRYADESGKPADVILPDYLIECLNAWQAIAKEEEEPVSTPLVFAGAAFQMYPHGAGKGMWRWLLTCPSFNLCVGRGKINGVVAQVRFAAPFLWSYELPGQHAQDIWTPLILVQDFLVEFFKPASGRLHLQVSALDLCADVTGWDVSACGWETSFVSRARTRVDRAQVPDDVAGGPPVAVYSGRKLATLQFGSHGSALSACIYHKSLEIKTSGKLWFQDIWRLHGWDGSSPVWRVEFRWRREALHEVKHEEFHGIEEIWDLDRSGCLSFLWAYGAGHVQGGEDGWPDGWLRYVVPSEDTNISRWPVHPAWELVQSAFCEETERAVNIHTGEVLDLPVSPLAALIRQRHYEVNVKRLSQQMGGCAATLAAWLGGPVESLPKVLAHLVDALPLYALPDLAKVAPLERLQAEYAVQFAEKVAARRAVYGLLAEETEVQR